jgi:hypothetical protein
MMGARGGWFLPVKSTLIGEPTAFIQPFLDVNKITQETEYHLKEMKKRTTADCKNFMAVCHEEWDNLVTQGLDNIQEGVRFGEDKEMNDNEEDDDSKYDLCEGNLNLKQPPAIFVWDKDLAERVLKTELEEGTPKDTHEAVEEIQAAFGDLEGMVVDSRRVSHKDAFDVLTHIGYSVTEIVAVIDRINKYGRRLMFDIGSIDKLREESGQNDITLVEAVIKALAATPQEELSGEVEELSKTPAEVGTDLARNCTLLNNKIQSLEKTHASLGSVNHSSAGLQMSTPIFDDNGVQVSTLGRVIQDNVDLRRANDQLKDRIESLSADVTAQGWVVLCRFMFTSEL